MKSLSIKLCISALLVLFVMTAVSASAQNWETIVFGEDWQTEEASYTQAIPELAAQKSIPSTASDTEFLQLLLPEKLQELNLAVAECYQRMDQATEGYANRKTRIYACRELPDYFLLWIVEPDIRDGARSLIYSKSKKRIVGAFDDGGILG